MKTYQIILFIFIATLASCSTSSTDEENELYNIEETNLEVSVSENETALLEIINTYRSSIGLRELIMDPSIAPFANEHNLFMIEDDAISHSNFAVRSDKVINTTNAENVSENVARFFNSNEQVLQGWLNSASHKATLEGDFTHTVINITEDSEGKKYYTQLFYN